jgi:hypothetical protein
MNGTPKRAIDTSAREPKWSRTCVFCHAEMDARRWADLPLVQVLDRQELQPHLSVRMGWDVEVRRCACGALIASFGSRMAV